jgi:cyclopropane fatty-acyl-phospholipid synthase-like methyltransferase
MVQKIEPTTEEAGQEITLVQIQGRKKYETKLVEQHQLRLRNNRYPISYTRYMNMGYWKGGAQTHDEAGEGLARLVGEAGQFSSSDYILDAGCGFAEQDLFWIGHFGVERITAIDIDSDTINVARDRARECGLSDRLELKVASAVEMPFSTSTYDKVVALESAVQFMRREDFFHEAHRVLRAGGRRHDSAPGAASPPPCGQPGEHVFRRCLRAQAGAGRLHERLPDLHTPTRHQAV